jgi:hypothetical protein
MKEVEVPRQPVTSVRQRRISDTLAARVQAGKTIVSSRSLEYDAVQLAELTPRARKKLQKGQFAIPEKRAYPIHDEAHARNALARVVQHGTPEEKRRVKAAVRRKYPKMGGGK